MEKQVFHLFLSIYFISAVGLYAQEVQKSDKAQEISKLFRNQEILPIKLSYSKKDIKKNTNDSTYAQSKLSYKESDGSWKNLNIELRRRGNYRLKNCYHPPLKLKIDKSVVKGTLFKGNKKLKLVLPCLKQKSANDNVVKEGMAYKLYEVISPYHFKTRMVDIDFDEIKGNKIINHKLKGILIEDDKKVAKRHNGKVLKRPMHPLNQDAITSVQNAIFQFMIANTDYSTAYRHNEKLMVINKKIMPIPFDFDMCGLVDATYAVVSQVNNKALPITKVTQRMYRGFKRDDKFLQQVRKEFLDNKTILLQIIDSFKPHFDNPNEFYQTQKFISSFFEVMIDDKKFKNNIINKARTK